MGMPLELLTIHRRNSVTLIELILVRSFSLKDKQHAIDLFNHLPLTGSKIPAKISLFGNQALPTDLQICLSWDTPCDPGLKTEVGEKLVAAFKAYGWVSHSIWEPLKEIV